MHFFSKETFMTQGNTHGHETNKVFSYQRTCTKKGYIYVLKIKKEEYVIHEKQNSLHPWLRLRQLAVSKILL